MSWSRIWAEALFMKRLLVRSWRFWILAVLALVLSAFAPTYYGGLRFFLSGAMGTAAIIHPSFIPWISYMLLTVVLGLAVVWFSFDASYRLRSSRTEEVLHASPATSTDMVLGQFLGILMPTSVAALVSGSVALLIQLAWGSGAPFKEHFVHLVFQMIPSLAAITAVTMALSLVTRSRVIGGILGTAFLVVGASNLFGWLPKFMGAIEIQQVLDLTGMGTLTFPSHMTGYLFFDYFLMQRAYVLVWVAGFLALCVWAFPRLRGQARTSLAPVISIGCFVLAILVAAVWVNQGSAVRRSAGEAAAEQEALAGQPATRVAHYDLSVDLTRRGKIGGRAAMRLVNDTAEPRTDWTFLLNAGLEVESVEGAEFERGLSTLLLRTPPVAPGEETEVVVAYGGRPSELGLFPGGRFEMWQLYGQQRGNVYFTLGMTPFIMDEYVYLPPMAKFYPVPDVDVGHKYPDRRPVNWATVRLEAKMPEGWAIATQGAPEAGAAGGSSQVWASDVPVPAFSIYAGPYDVVEATVGDLPVRLLYHPGHDGAVEFFSEAKDLILERATDKLKRAREMTGLEYPYPLLNLVEVPLTARAYSDGLDSHAAFHTPGVVALREAGIFTANLKRASIFRQGVGLERRDRDSRVRVQVNVGSEEDAEAGEGEEAPPAPAEDAPEPGGEEPAAGTGGEGREEGEAEGEAEGEEEEPPGETDAVKKANLLEDFFKYDFVGGNVSHAVMPSMWDFVIQPQGPLNPLMARGLTGFVAERATGTRRNFSVFALQDLQQTIQQFFPALFRGVEVDDAVVAAGVDMDKVYEVMTTTPLAEMDPSEDPRTYLDLITVRGHAFFEALEQELGATAFTEALALLRERHAYGFYTLEDLRTVVEEVKGEDCGWLFDSWLEGTDLPGFRLLDVKAFRIESQDPQAKYQVMARLQNPEPVDGYATIRIRLSGEEEPLARTLRVEGGKAVEYGVILQNQPTLLSIDPILAYNRFPINHPFRGWDWKPKDPGPEGTFEGTREAEFEPWATGVVVDDAEDGFRIEGEKRGFSLRFQRSREDEGELPEFVPPQQGFRPPGKWSTWRTRFAYGRYNPTFHVVRSGSGDTAAVWEGELETGGEYEVMVHLPGKTLEKRIPERVRERMAMAPTYTYRIETAEGEQSVDLDTGRSEDGWNSLGTFYFDSGPAKVTLRDDVGKGMILADAVRWVPAGKGSTKPEAEEDENV